MMNEAAEKEIKKKIRKKAGKKIFIPGMSIMRYLFPGSWPLSAWTVIPVLAGRLMIIRPREKAEKEGRAMWSSGLNGTGKSQTRWN